MLLGRRPAFHPRLADKCPPDGREAWLTMQIARQGCLPTAAKEGTAWGQNLRHNVLDGNVTGRQNTRRPSRTSAAGIRHLRGRGAMGGDRVGRKASS